MVYARSATQRAGRRAPSPLSPPFPTSLEDHMTSPPSSGPSVVITPEELLTHWKEHRRLTRRV